MGTTPSATTYQGSCHCGAVKFRFRSEPITEALRCNCSICLRKGTTMSVRYYAPSEIESMEGLKSLSVYLWGDRMVNHYFCPTCGVYPFHDATTKPEHYRFNLGCVDGLDVLALPIRMVDGRSFPVEG